MSWIFSILRRSERSVQLVSHFTRFTFVLHTSIRLCWITSLRVKSFLLFVFFLLTSVFAFLQMNCFILYSEFKPIFLIKLLTLFWGCVWFLSMCVKIVDFYRSVKLHIINLKIPIFKCGTEQIGPESIYNYTDNTLMYFGAVAHTVKYCKYPPYLFFICMFCFI